MKRFRKRYILLAFSSLSTPAKDQSKYVDEVLGSNKIKASIVQYGPTFLVYRCPHKLAGDFKRLFPLALPGGARATVEGVSGTLKRLRNNYIRQGRKHLS
ncbi:MAG: hypothetical protein JTT11_06295 [Candidatus Brockarchaeota archaeon]|nr:hypothetical protein [Candidatus Brockarchaeota archaeon]